MLQSSGETQMIHKRRRLLPRQPQSLFDDLIFSLSLKQHLVINRLQKSGHRFYMEELNIKRERGERRQLLTRDSTFNVNKKWGDIFRDWNKSTGLPEHRAFFTGCVYVCVRVERHTNLLSSSKCERRKIKNEYCHCNTKAFEGGVDCQNLSPYRCPGTPIYATPNIPLTLKYQHAKGKKGEK